MKGVFRIYDGDLVQLQRRHVWPENLLFDKPLYWRLLNAHEDEDAHHGICETLYEYIFI